MTELELESKFKLTKDIALTGELWGVNFDDLEEYWRCYDRSALWYFMIITIYLHLDKRICT